MDMSVQQRPAKIARHDSGGGGGGGAAASKKWQKREGMLQSGDLVASQVGQFTGAELGVEEWIVTTVLRYISEVGQCKLEPWA